MGLSQANRILQSSQKRTRLPYPVHVTPLLGFSLFRRKVKGLYYNNPYCFLRIPAFYDYKQRQKGLSIFLKPLNKLRGNCIDKHMKPSSSSPLFKTTQLQRITSQFKHVHTCLLQGQQIFHPHYLKDVLRRILRTPGLSGENDFNQQQWLLGSWEPEREVGKVTGHVCVPTLCHNWPKVSDSKIKNNNKNCSCIQGKSASH